MSSQVSIPARYNGPPNSGNGGYSCGVVAGFIGGAARVRLSSPPPLDTPAEIIRTPDGAVEMRVAGTLIATGWPDSPVLDIPAAPTLTQAREAARGFIGLCSHALPTCYVCGPDRVAGDGMELFAGRVGDSPIYACPWSPRSDQLDDAGVVRSEIVWAALDCPGYFAAFEDESRSALLGELTANLRAPVPGDGEFVVFAWSIGRAGRKRFAGTAIADEDGRVLAAARATWIELKGASTTPGSIS